MSMYVHVTMHLHVYNVSMCACITHAYTCEMYCIRSLFGGGFNLAVWRFFVCPPNLNNANIVS